MKNLYKELAEYTGRDLELVIARSEIATIELAWQWEKHKNDPLAFYRESDLYIFNLTRYQTRLQKGKIPTWFQYMIKKHGWKTGLDIGGGIGEQTILAMEEGVDMRFVEVEGSQTAKYAQWRFKKHKVNPDEYLTEEESDLHFLALYLDHLDTANKFDFIVAMDIFEHLENPIPVIEKIHANTNWLFCNPDQVKFNKWVPQHISKFDLSKYFKRKDLYLWEKI